MQSSNGLLHATPSPSLLRAALMPTDVPFGDMLKAFFSQETVQSLMAWLAGLSLATFFLSLLLIPIIVRTLAPDCFILLCKTSRDKPQLTVARFCFLVVRNFFGIFLLVAGFAMLFLPGQGLLAMLLGVLLLSFPGKKRLIVYLLNFSGVRQALDWLRKKSGKQPFSWPTS